MKKELSFVDYALQMAMEKKRQSQFGGAVVHLENAIRSLKELERNQQKEETASHIYNEFEKMDERSRKYVLRQLVALYE